MSYLAELEKDGAALAPGVLEGAARAALTRAVAAKTGAAYAVRNLADLVPAVGALAARPALRALVEPVLGPRARLVRAILFDKTPEANWKVAWHQDLTIAVRERRSVPGYGPWSVKAGVPHVQPPRAVLESMLALRVHLDDADQTNGALLIVPGSHKAGKIGSGEFPAWRERAGTRLCAARRGDVLAMRPLLLHASSAGQAPSRRRVIHLEYCSAALPEGLAWA